MPLVEHKDLVIMQRTLGYPSWQPLSQTGDLGPRPTFRHQEFKNGMTNMSHFDSRRIRKQNNHRRKSLHHLGGKLLYMSEIWRNMCSCTGIRNNGFKPWSQFLVAGWP